MAALATGQLVLAGGCIRLGSASGDLLVWPADFTLKSEHGVLEILDGSGQAVAQVGEEVRMAGGQVPSIGLMGEYVRQQLNIDCPGTYYWIVGEVMEPK